MKMRKGFQCKSLMHCYMHLQYIKVFFFFFLQEKGTFFKCNQRDSYGICVVKRYFPFSNVVKKSCVVSVTFNVISHSLFFFISFLFLYITFLFLRTESFFFSTNCYPQFFLILYQLF